MGQQNKAQNFMENAKAAETTFKSQTELAIALNNSATIAAQSNNLDAAGEQSLRAVKIMERRLAQFFAQGRPALLCQNEEFLKELRVFCVACINLGSVKERNQEIPAAREMFATAHKYSQKYLGKTDKMTAVLRLKVTKLSQPQRPSAQRVGSQFVNAGSIPRLPRIPSLPSIPTEPGQHLARPLRPNHHHHHSTHTLMVTSSSQDHFDRRGGGDGDRSDQESMRYAGGVVRQSGGVVSQVGHVGGAQQAQERRGETERKEREEWMKRETEMKEKENKLKQKEQELEREKKEFERKQLEQREKLRKIEREKEEEMRQKEEKQWSRFQEMMERQQERQIQELTRQAIHAKESVERERREIAKLKESLMAEIREEMKKEMAGQAYKEQNESQLVRTRSPEVHDIMNATMPAPRAIQSSNLAVMRDETGGMARHSFKSLSTDKANSSIISRKALIPPLNLPKDGRQPKRVAKEDEKEQWAAKRIQSAWKKQKRSTDFSIESTPDSSGQASRNPLPPHFPSQPTPPSYPQTKPIRKPSKFRTIISPLTRGSSGKLSIKEDVPLFNNNWLISAKLGRRARQEPPDVRKLPTSLVSLNGIFQINEGASGYKAGETLRVLQTCVGQRVHKVVEGNKNMVASLTDYTGGATEVFIEVNCTLQTVEEQAAGEDLMMEKEEQMANLMLVIRGGVRGHPELQIEPEELMLADLSDLLGQVVCKDVLSHGKPVRQLHTFQDFCNYMVYPYLVVTNDTSERRHLRFVMFARAVGLLEEPLISSFFNTQVALIFNHVQGRTFRVSLVQAKCEQLTIQIDLVVEDDETYNYYFQDMQCSRTKTDDEGDSESKEMGGEESEREKWLMGVKIKEGKHFEMAQLLEEAVKTVERVVHDKSDMEAVEDVLKGKKTVRYLFEQIQDFALFRVTLASRGKRAVLWAMQQIPLEFKQNTGVIRDSMCLLQIRSGWHIYVYSIHALQLAPGRFEKVVRHFFYSHEQIERQFGVPADSIRNQAELLLFLDMALDTLQLEIPDEQDLDSNKDGSKDSKFYSVSRRFMQTFCHKRLLKQTATLNPITLQLIGIRKLKILGVKITLFNPITLREQGVFFKVNSEKWQFSGKDIERQKQIAQHSKYNKKDPLVQFSHVYDALNDFGFKILLNELELRKGPEGHLELLLKTPFGPSRVDVLERIFDRKRYFFEFQTYF